VLEILQGAYGNPGRGLHEPALHALARRDQAHAKIAAFGGVSTEETIILGGATECFVLLAHALGEQLSPSDEIIVGETEHHSNWLPWQAIATDRHAHFVVAPISKETYTVSASTLEPLLSSHTKVVCLALVSNVLGTLLPLEEAAACIRKCAPNAKIVIDACQAAAHYNLQQVVALADFTIISGHKLYAPNGVGVIWSRREQLLSLNSLRPGGGTVSGFINQTPHWQPLPHLHTGGTANLEAMVGLETAMTFLDAESPQPTRHDHAFTLAQAYKQALINIPEIQLVVPVTISNSIVSFTVDGLHPHDIAEGLAGQSVCVRAGHHCAAPLHHSLGLSQGSVRISFGIYSSTDEVEKCMLALKKVITTLRGY
jgi:cysteine desulfurase/selenocysteine lyase